MLATNARTEEDVRFALEVPLPVAKAVLIRLRQDGLVDLNVSKDRSSRIKSLWRRRVG